MKKILFALCLLFAAILTQAQDVSINGNKFYVEGNEIWFNGVNTPWHKWVDFGRTDFDYQWWEDEFARYEENNINLARVWIHMSGEISPDIDETGYVSGASDLFWEQMDYLFAISKKHGVYIMPALLSFDITKNTFPTYERWRLWLQSTSNIQSYIDNVLIPMVQRYENEPYLLAWEICNEPEWMFEVAADHGPQSFYDVQTMHAMFAAAVHENSSSMVTTGSAAPKWNSPIYDSWGDYEGNMFSDEALSGAINNSDAYLDFYQYHWYPWQTEWMESPFTQTTVEYGVDDRPVIVGESEGNDVCDDYICQTVTQMYESAYLNGFDGVCAWKTPQNDGHGTFENIAVATNAFYANHPTLVYPEGSRPTPVTGVSLSATSISIAGNQTYQLIPTIEPADATVKNVTWESANPTIASVSKDGVVTGVTQGSTTITVTSVYGGFTASCSVVVTSSGSLGNCTNPVSVALPYTYNGAGPFCLVTSGDITVVQTYSTDHVELNEIDITNSYYTNIPAKRDGLYWIYYESGSYGYLGIQGSGGVTGDTRTLTTSVTGQGSVSPSGGSFTLGSTVQLTATPAAGYEFSSWSGDASGTSNPVSITMDANKSVIANFTEILNPNEYTLTVVVVGQGTVTPGTAVYTEGTVVTLTAAPAAGYEFAGWSGAASGTSLTTNVTMDANKTVTATFQETGTTQYTLNVSTSGSGTVSLSPAGGTYDEGTVVTLTANPATGNEFVSWSGDLSGSTNPATITMNANKSVLATFQVSGGDICDNPTAISIPFAQNGTGEFCWETTGDISYVNSWNMAVVQINGVDYTNTWSNSMPAKIDGKYYIYYNGIYAWSHFEAAGTNGRLASGMPEIISGNTALNIYPNPSNSDFTISLNEEIRINAIEVFDQNGRKVMEKRMQELLRGDFTFGKELGKGLYIVRVSSDKQSFIQKLVKE